MISVFIFTMDIQQGLNLHVTLTDEADRLSCIDSLGGFTLEQKTDSQKEEETKAKQKEIDRQLSLAEKTCLCFLIDCTGSMHLWINKVKENIKLWSEKLHAKYTHMELHVAFVQYTDYDQPEYKRTTTLDFTIHLDQFYTFVDRITTPDGIGGDTCEDVFGGLDAVLKLNWPEAGTKVMIHITDAPCHGLQYHDSRVSDDYPDGDPAGLQLDDLMKQFVDKEITYYFGYIKKSATLTMTKAFNESMLAQSRNAHSIQQFDASNPSNLLEGVYRSVTCSITSTVMALVTGEGTRQLRDYTIVKEVPNWDDLPSQVVMVTPPPPVGSAPKIEVPSQPKKIKIAPQPFGEGKQKVAYHAYDEDENEHWVLKRSKYSDARSNSVKRCLETAMIHAIATNFAAEFNRKNTLKPYASQIQFVPVGVLELTTHDKSQYYYTYEPYLGDDDEYTKFNTNFLYVPTQEEDQLSNTCQAFSHYTWEISGKRQVICDLQGVKIGPKVVLTDPAIHCTNIMCHGSTNLGTGGIDQFCRTHECNDLCMNMGLKNLNEAD